MSDPVAVDAGLRGMNRTRKQWDAVTPDAFLTGSIVQARNVIEMARADILRLYAALQAAEERAAERMRERVLADLSAHIDKNEARIAANPFERQDRALLEERVMALNAARSRIRALPLSETETQP